MILKIGIFRIDTKTEDVDVLSLVFCRQLDSGNQFQSGAGSGTLCPRDTGCGIEDIDRAMEPLFTTAGGERAGLGFAVMQSFMDGVRVHSTPGKGTTVTLSKTLSLRARGADRP